MIIFAATKNKIATGMSETQKMIEIARGFIRAAATPNKTAMMPKQNATIVTVAIFFDMMSSTPGMVKKSSRWNLISSTRMEIRSPKKPRGGGRASGPFWDAYD